VDRSSTNATPPYTKWTTAATNIQDAVDAAVAGDEIVVTSGIYAAGGGTGFGLHGANRVEVDKPLSLRSLNGPQSTIIDGGGSVRCVYLTNGASLSGFTLTNGSVFAASALGGGVLSESASALVSNCVVSGNSAFAASFISPQAYGGGAFGGTLNNCILIQNSVGAQNSPFGGEAYSAGGGAANCTLNNCTLTANSDGAWHSTLSNCALVGNSGSGAVSSTLTNCTLTGNSWGGAFSCTLNNCIVYFNTAPWGPNYDPSCTLNYCCTTPLPTNGLGNISSDPQLASAYRLSALSPCIGKGNYPAVSGVDIDGEPWANPPSMGCDEYHAGSVTGLLSASITASRKPVKVGYAADFTALIEGRTDLSLWDFGDGTVEINEPYAAHSWSAPADYLVSLWAFNDSHPGGITATMTVHVVTGLHYVAAGSANPETPYTSWATAATNIQDAIDAAPEPGAQVLVTNGTYAAITAYGLLAVSSVSGPLLTIIDGGHSNGCVSLSEDASLSGFTLTNGFAIYGGGANGGTLNNCILSGNSVHWFSTETGNILGCGGGAYGCTLNNCTLTGNSTPLGYGGGADHCTLNNCTLTGNSAVIGGGASTCTLNNCIVYSNTSTNGANYDSASCTLNFCCTMPQPTYGFGSITNAPLFTGPVGGNLRLQANSPCINAGNNAYAVGTTDLDGNPRIRGRTVDIGAYEFQSPTSIISYAWLQQYGMPTDGSADFTDPDGDGMNNWQEWRCGTDPTNALSALRLLAPLRAGTNITVTWQSVAGVNYFLERSTNLAGSVFTSLATNIPGQPGITTFTDTNFMGRGLRIYRVGVRAQ
jgi:hypothetical protein